MKPARTLWLLGLSIVGSGCALVEDSSRNFCVALKTPIEIHREQVRNEKWAESSWQMICEKDGPDAHSADFAQGFKDGFAELLFRGGDGEPPLVAPLKYRDIRFQNPMGYRAIQDWFDGYRLGAITARDSGARQWITGPSSLRPGELHEAAMPFPIATKLPAVKAEPERIVLPPPAVLPLAPSDPQPATSVKMEIPAAMSEAPPAASAKVEIPPTPREPQPAASAKVEVPAPPSDPPPVAPVEMEAPAAPSVARPVFGAPATAPREMKARITNVSTTTSDSSELDRSNVLQGPENTTDAPRARIKAIMPPRPN